MRINFRTNDCLRVEQLDYLIFVGLEKGIINVCEGLGRLAFDEDSTKVCWSINELMDAESYLLDAYVCSNRCGIIRLFHVETFARAAQVFPKDHGETAKTVFMLVEDLRERVFLQTLHACVLQRNSIRDVAGGPRVVNGVDIKGLLFQIVIRIEENWLTVLLCRATFLRFTTQLELFHVKLDFREDHFSFFFEIHPDFLLDVTIIAANRIALTIITTQIHVVSLHTKTLRLIRLVRENKACIDAMAAKILQDIRGRREIGHLKLKEVGVIMVVEHFDKFVVEKRTRLVFFHSHERDQILCDVLLQQVYAVTLDPRQVENLFEQTGGHGIWRRGFCVTHVK